MDCTTVVIQQLVSMNMRIINLFLLSCLLTASFAQDQGDWVNPANLPIHFATDPFYSGYLAVGTGRQYFYVYHPSQSNPSKDPVMVRLGAGPGCSPLYSWVYSKGPFIFVRDNSDFRVNEFPWNKQANLVFIQGPVGVGYASSTNGSSYSSDDEYSSEVIKALYSFYAKFPQLKDQQLYLSGQEYAGVTIPIIAKKIIQKNNDQTTPVWQNIKLKGFLLQNPCTMADQCITTSRFDSFYTIEYLKNHYFISKQTYAEFLNKCQADPAGEQCKSQKASIQSFFNNLGADIGSIYLQCLKTNTTDYKCLDTKGLFAFFRNRDVKVDLNVKPNSSDWDLCNKTIMANYIRNNGSLHVYQQLLREQRDLRIWIVSGTQSASVPTVGTRRWVQSLKLSLNRPSTRIWDAWKYDNDINAGQIQEFPGLTFLTVRSAGRDLYTDQPQVGNHVFTSFIKGIPL